MNHRFDGPEVGLFLNGETPINDYKKYYFLYEKIFAVNGAFSYLKKLKIQVDCVIGDFDSCIKKKVFSKKIFVTSDQNYTDFEKALKIIYEKGYYNINVWGASGKEQDHFLGNLSTALKYKNKLSIIFHDNYHSYFFSFKKNFLLGRKNKKISLFPFPKVEGLSTYGLRYSLTNRFLEIGKYIGIRNESIENKIEINYEKGELLIFIER
ncbi:thiamine diphosphokinase [Blattabacterium cuenoti]|uniref:thiamine diphosphokinase n=1 Tax=Blattabacterium cuenoti TaxID=1653831 RepID=UPI00163C26B6|nr:thiamine diphosphokinase [Blattabacterium cuenoti]